MLLLLLLLLLLLPSGLRCDPALIGDDQNQSDINMDPQRRSPAASQLVH